MSHSLVDRPGTSVFRGDTPDSAQRRLHFGITSDEVAHPNVHVSHALSQRWLYQWNWRLFTCQCYPIEALLTCGLCSRGRNDTRDGSGPSMPTHSAAGRGAVSLTRTRAIRAGKEATVQRPGHAAARLGDGWSGERRLSSGERFPAVPAPP